MDRIIETLKLYGSESEALNELMEIITDTMIRNNMTPAEAYNWLYEITYYGCISGCISQFITYYSCNKFFNKHYTTILDDLDNFGYEGSLQIDHLVWNWAESHVLQASNLLVKVTE